METSQDQLELDSQLPQLERVWPWIESQADRHGISEDVRFSIQLCMEEALANLVIHGYRNKPGHPIVIRSSASEKILTIEIDDKAPPFAPADPRLKDDTARQMSLDSIEPGGNGIRLLYKFAGSIRYERLTDGNRLTLCFPIVASELPRPA